MFHEKHNYAPKQALCQGCLFLAYLGCPLSCVVLPLTACWRRGYAFPAAYRAVALAVQNLIENRIFNLEPILGNFRTGDSQHHLTKGEIVGTPAPSL